MKGSLPWNEWRSLWLSLSLPARRVPPSLARRGPTSARDRPRYWRSRRERRTYRRLWSPVRHWLSIQGGLRSRSRTCPGRHRPKLRLWPSHRPLSCRALHGRRPNPRLSAPPRRRFAICPRVIVVDERWRALRSCLMAVSMCNADGMQPLWPPGGGGFDRRCRDLHSDQR